MLIIFKREDKSLYRKCEKCRFFVEFKDDEKQYPKTVGVVCSAEQTYMVTCFNYMWFMASGHYKGSSIVKLPSEEWDKINTLREIANNLKKLGERK